MRGTSRPATLGALGALGALAVHQAAYLIAYPATTARHHALGDHDHLGPQWVVITPLAVLAMVGLVAGQVRRLEVARPTTMAALPRRRLAWTIAGLYGLQEAAEAAFVHHDLAALARNPALYLGLALAPVVALGLLGLIGGATLVVGAWLPPAGRLALPRPVSWPLACHQGWRPPLCRGSSAPRGPPLPTAA